MFSDDLFNDDCVFGQDEHEYGVDDQEDYYDDPADEFEYLSEIECPGDLDEDEILARYYDGDYDIYEFD